MALTQRCPSCGASNPETAEWCSLCLERFVEPEPESAPEPEHAPEPEAAPGPAQPEPAANGTPGPAAPSVTTSTTTPTTPTTKSDAFEVTENGIKWICRTCGTPNDLDLPACAVCGATFAEHVRPTVERPQKDPARAALYSLFFPGAGHAYVGMWGQAVARGVLSLWVLLVAVVGILDKDVPGSLGMAALFGVVALGLWLIAAHDAFREASNDEARVLLRGRRFLYVVLGLMALLFVAMLLALMTARSRAPDDALSIRPWPSTSFPTSMEQPTI